MKDFDVVKFTMWLGVVLLVAVLAGKWWVGGLYEDEQVRLRTMKTMLKEIGKYSGEIEFREQELEEDSFVKYVNTPATFFQQCARAAAIDSNADYKMVPKAPDDNPAGFRDTQFTITMKKGREMERRKIARLCYAVETESPRVKLVSADLRLEHRDAELDLWKATLIFMRRDPIKN